MAEVSIKRSFYLISDQFIYLIAREVIKVIPKSGLCQAPLWRGSLQMTKYWLIVSILWTGVELVLQVTSYSGVKLPLSTERNWICFFRCKPYN